MHSVLTSLSFIFFYTIVIIYYIFFYFRLEANGGDDQYDEYGPQQKNDIHLAEGEDEGEGNLRTIE